MSAEVRRELLQIYCAHRRFFSLDYFQNFKLFASWYSQEPLDTGYEVCPATGGLPWYRTNWTVSELAKILKCTDQEVLGAIEDIYNDY